MIFEEEKTAGACVETVYTPEEADTMMAKMMNGPMGMAFAPEGIFEAVDHRPKKKVRREKAGKHHDGKAIKGQAAPIASIIKETPNDPMITSVQEMDDDDADKRLIPVLRFLCRRKRVNRKTPTIDRTLTFPSPLSSHVEWEKRTQTYHMQRKSAGPFLPQRTLGALNYVAFSHEPSSSSKPVKKVTSKISANLLRVLSDEEIQEILAAMEGMADDREEGKVSGSVEKDVEMETSEQDLGQ